MANRISVLKSEAVGVIPTASAMAVGEIAVNYADKKIYGKHPGSGAVVQVAASPIHSHALSDLTQSGATSGQVVAWNGTAWVPSDFAASDLPLDFTGVLYNGIFIPLTGVQNDRNYYFLGGVPFEGMSANYSIYWDGSQWVSFFEAGDGEGAYSSRTNYAIGDTEFPAQASWQSNPGYGGGPAPEILSTIEPHAHKLSDLAQSGATTGQVATWNGTAWAPSTPAAAGVSSVAGRTGAVTLTLADVPNAVGSVVSGINNATPITNMMQITTAGYNAIIPAANTLYIIVG